ncbi:MAG: hypothetical protein Q8R16_04485, partial [bacterium]|nr:hypothetical protein [bacterium]
MSKRHHTHDGTAELLRGRSIPKDRHVHFWDEKGEIHFGYREQYRGRELKFSCCVPQEVLERGTTAIRTYAATQVRTWRKKPRTDADRFDAFAAHPDFPIIIKHRGLTITGRIISAANNTLRVRLEEPYTGESFVEYRWASA